LHHFSDRDAALKRRYDDRTRLESRHGYVYGTSSIKIVLTGCGGVGKSALVIRFVTDNWCEEYDPTIEGTVIDANMTFIAP
jgi:GTPase SAR1 family protein